MSISYYYPKLLPPLTLVSILARIVLRYLVSCLRFLKYNNWTKYKLGKLLYACAQSACVTFVFVNSLFTGLFLLHKDFAFPQAFLLMLASFSLFAGAEAMGIFNIFAKMTQQSIDRMNQIKTIPKLEDISCWRISALYFKMYFCLTIPCWTISE